ncbi:MAG: VCBS repeat-containing protein [Ignavibacteria bacterium]|nr:VCBS repeat-containing protein [Ignavibacteria bacterium]
MKKILFILFIISPIYSYSQNFTSILNPNNPVISDTFATGGAFWADINNDGLLDLFFANGNVANQNNSLFLNTGNLNFRKIISGAVVNDGGSSIGSSFGDYNNDGYLDLFVTNRNFFKNFLYRGNGDTSFLKITNGNIVTDSGNSNSSHWVDINRDGLLDLYVINFQGNDYLYINNGSPEFTFTSNTTLPILLDGNAFSIVGGWADYNNDKLPDLFIGNGGNANNILYKNLGGLNFQQIVMNDSRSTLGLSWGDYDNDGDLDLFVANYLNQNNILYNNSGFPDYTLVRIDTGIVSNDGGASVGSSWIDIENDGDLDLIVANDNGQNEFLYINSGYPLYAFTKNTSNTITTRGGNSFGCSAGDYNNDGQVDFVVANRDNQNNFLFLNDGNNNSWVGIKCMGTVSNRSAIGTKVYIKSIINGQQIRQMREIVSQTGYNSGNLILNFGLGNSSVIDSIRVEWTNGNTSHFTNVQPNRYYTVSESGSITGITQNSKSISNPGEFKLFQNYPNPFNPETTIEFNVSKKEEVKIKVFDMTGKLVKLIYNGILERGNYKFLFNGSELPSGIYYYSYTSRENSQTKKMILIK